MRKYFFLLLIIGTTIALTPRYARAQSSVPPRVIAIDFGRHVKSTTSCALAAALTAAGIRAATMTVEIWADVILSIVPPTAISELFVIDTVTEGSVLRLIGLPGFYEGCKTMFGNIWTSYDGLGAQLEYLQTQRRQMTAQCPREGGHDLLPECLRGCGVTGAIAHRESILNQMFSDGHGRERTSLDFTEPPLSTNPWLTAVAWNQYYRAAWSFCYYRACALTRAPIRAVYDNVSQCQSHIKSDWDGIHGYRPGTGVITELRMPHPSFAGWFNTWRERVNSFPGGIRNGSLPTFGPFQPIDPRSIHPPRQNTHR